MSGVLLESIADSNLPKADIRLAFFDIDGTLLGKDGGYTAATAEAVRRLGASGVYTAIASGRPHYAAEFVAREFAMTAPGVVNTGATIFDFKNQSLCYNAELDADVAMQLWQSVHKSGVYYEAYAGADYFIDPDAGFSASALNIAATHAKHMRVGPKLRRFDEIIGVEPVTKFLVAVDSDEMPEFLAQLQLQFPNLIFATAGIAEQPSWRFANIISASATKRNAFNWFLQRYNLEACNVIAFGDAQSDVEFLQMAGIGIAMGNALESVKASADYVTKPVWEDGVAYALQRLLSARN